MVKLWKRVGGVGLGVLCSSLLVGATVMPVRGVVWVSHPGMTWTVLASPANGTVHVGADSITNPYNGDTAVSVQLPILCLLVTGAGVPPSVTPDYYNGWAEGSLALSLINYPGGYLWSRAAADQDCSNQFGSGWRMAEFHDGRYGPNLSGSGGWSYWGYGGTIAPGTRFWVAINDQPANPWS